MKKEKRLAVCVAAMILAVLGLSGCGRTRVVFTTGLSDKEVFRIGDEVCTLPEMIVYLTMCRMSMKRYMETGSGKAATMA